MSSRGRYEDASTLLFLVPFIASGAYGIYLWASAGLTPVFPASAYLEVTRDPYVFLAGIFAVLVGVMLDLSGVEPQKRRERLAWTSGYLQKTAAACFILSLLMAWYANGFLDIGGAADDFVVGRYSIVFPALLFLFSYLVNPSLKLGGAASYKFLGFLAMLAVPAVVYEVGKRNIIVGLASGTVFMVAGLYLLLRTGSKPTDQSQA
jgi:hypothetical protein